MTQTEWIISLDDDLKDHDEMFVGNVRDGDILTRCKDCKYASVGRNEVDSWRWCKVHRCDFEMNDYCSWAERKEE